MLEARDTSMTPLRLRMTEDMTLAGFTPGTQAVYIDAVRRLAAHYRRSPDQLSEEEVRSYLLGLRDRGVALGTFKTNHGGIQFLYRRTLDRDWPLFWKKKDSTASANAAA
jgi:hypothetical protein